MKSTRIMFVNFGHDEELTSLIHLQKIRNAGIAAEVYPDHVKMKKQMSYADDNKIPFVGIIGSEEREEDVITLKEMKTGIQEKLTIESLIDKLQSV
jgi:histidyl-tRNA synthetase